MPMLSTEDLPVALLLPGQGAQQPRMAAGLYGHDDVFTDAMDEAFRLLGPHGTRVRTQWLADSPPPGYHDVTVAQPLLYAVNHALGRMVLDWGVRPVALLGHSVGELVAATLAGVLSFADGVRLMRDRVELFARTPPGGMLAVAASVAEVEGLLGSGGVHLAAVNAPRQLLLAGETRCLERAARILEHGGVVCRPALARQAFHSPVVEPAVAASRPSWRATPLYPPALPVYSAYTDGVLDARTARDPDFWAEQPAATVHFAPALDRLLAEHRCLLLEVGPGASLSALARRHPGVVRGGSRVASLLPDRRTTDAADRDCVAAARRLVGARQPVSSGG
jgi:acyl transferase domain-containing protein